MLDWIEIRRWTWPLKNIQFLCLQVILSCFRSMFRLIIHLHCEAASYQFCSIWLNASREYIALKCTVLRSAVTPSMNSHTCPCHSTTTTLFDTRCGVGFGSCAVPLRRHTFLFPSGGYRLANLGFISPKNLIPEHGRLLDVFWPSLILLSCS